MSDFKTRVFAHPKNDCIDNLVRVFYVVKQIGESSLISEEKVNKRLTRAELKVTDIR